jgi:hypothetical protein
MENKKYIPICTKERYDKLLGTGLFKEVFPELTGDWYKNLYIVMYKNVNKKHEIIRNKETRIWNGFVNKANINNNGDRVEGNFILEYDWNKCIDEYEDLIYDLNKTQSDLVNMIETLIESGACEDAICQTNYKEARELLEKIKNNET